MTTRIEHDLPGDTELPADAWFGVRTRRAVDNFAIIGVPVSHFPHFVNALVMDGAAARADREPGLLAQRGGTR